MKKREKKKKVVSRKQRKTRDKRIGRKEQKHEEVNSLESSHHPHCDRNQCKVAVLNTVTF